MLRLTPYNHVRYFYPNIGIKWTLPVTYVWQTPWATQLTLTRPTNSTSVSTVHGALFQWSRFLFSLSPASAWLGFSLGYSSCGSTVSGHGRHDAVVGRSSGLCLPTFRPSASCAVEGSAIQGSGAHSCGSVLASAPLVSRPSGASGGCPSVPSTAEGSTQTAAFPPLPPEPPRASSDCVSSIERSARAFGFTSAVARQLARCRRASTRVNYQAKWSVFRAWCRRHGHSVSRPSVPKIASFLLYLRRSLSLSYSSIASYRSMLSGVFRFVFPELSSHFVLRDLCSFRLQCPLSSSRVPPWDLSRVLSFLRGPLFEPLSSCSLRDLTRKVL